MPCEDSEYANDRANGRASAVADLGAPITAPLLVLDEGEVVALTGDFLVGITEAGHLLLEIAHFGFEVVETRKRLGGFFLNGLILTRIDFLAKHPDSHAARATAGATRSNTRGSNGFGMKYSGPNSRCRPP